MAAIVMCGGGVVGLGAAMMLARDGHEVTALEWDAAPQPEQAADAWDSWDRNGVAQFRQPHNLFPRYRAILDEELPGTTDRLLAAGCRWVDPLAGLPPTIADRAPRAGDDRFGFATGRRPVIEAAIADAADETPGVEVRRGVELVGLTSGPSAIDGVPHVDGVVTASGERIEADLVIDAMGRRSKFGDWLTALGSSGPQIESEDSGFVYNTRYFRGPQLPPAFSPPVVEIGSFSLITLPGDNDTWSVTLFAASADAPLKALRDVDAFTRVVRACPLHAHWLDGEPITDVVRMAGVLDRYRRYVVDGVPVATGVAAVGDAWACTNPSAGRGITVGTIQAQCLRDVVRSSLDDPVTFAMDLHDTIESAVSPFYHFQIGEDRQRIANMDAIRSGREPSPLDPNRVRLSAAVMHDPDVFRAFLEVRMCLDIPQNVLSRPEVLDKVRAVSADASPPMPGPNRDELLRLLDGGQ